MGFVERRNGTYRARYLTRSATSAAGPSPLGWRALTRPAFWSHVAYLDR